MPLKTTSFRVEEEQLEQLKTLSHIERTTRSKLAREAFHLLLQARDLQALRNSAKEQVEADVAKLAKIAESRPPDHDAASANA